MDRRKLGISAMFMVLGLAMKVLFRNSLAGDVAAVLFVLAGVTMLIASISKQK